MTGSMTGSGTGSGTGSKVGINDMPVDIWGTP